MGFYNDENNGQISSKQLFLIIFYYKMHDLPVLKITIWVYFRINDENNGQISSKQLFLIIFYYKMHDLPVLKITIWVYFRIIEAHT